MNVSIYTAKTTLIRSYTDIIIDTNTQSGVFKIYSRHLTQKTLEGKAVADKLLFMGNLKNLYLIFND